MTRSTTSPDPAINDAVRAASPALDAALSPLGRRAEFPRDIPFQAAEARGKTYNGTIGQITDGRGGAVPLPPMAKALEGLGEANRNRALLYSPVQGIGEVRERWRGWQRRRAGLGEDSEGADGARSTLPVVTAGLTHGLSVVADLFAGAPDGRPRVVAAPAPFWGNYRQVFALRTGARIVSAPAFRAGRFNALALREALDAADLAPNEPALAIVNFPSNPGGYSPTPEERDRIASSLVEVAEERPLLAVCDDAYAGLVFEEGIPTRSMFWDLQGLHPNLVPIKVDGATKEFSFFGGRVGFVTFPFDPGTPIADALESKVKCMVRAGIGSPVATSQEVLLTALRRDDAEEQSERVRLLLAGRYRVLRDALAACDPDLLRPLPFNSGCFALAELGERPRAAGLTADAVRHHLLDAEDTGVVAIEERFLRIAHCSVDEADLPELVRRVERGVASLSG
ncbi:MAG: aminotransferase class I/II-fold pyridoxal phosphate-dependent enzyme [Acidobacteriota bacterium]|jgi:aspartate/methionine/tyrosine aminotransferase